MAPGDRNFIKNVNCDIIFLMNIIECLYRGVPRRWRRRGRWVLEPLLIICIPLPSTLIPLTLPTLSKPTSTSSTNSPGRLELNLPYIYIYRLSKQMNR